MAWHFFAAICSTFEPNSLLIEKRVQRHEPEIHVADATIRKQTNELNQLKRFYQ